MSCFPESTYAIYVDGELAADEGQLVETHLITCRTCRALVTALREETELLGDALHERAPAWQAPPFVPPAEVGVATGLPAAVTAATLVVTALGFLIHMGGSGGWSLLNPLRLKGVIEMGFDLVFLLRDRVPGLVELAVSVGATAAVSALLSLAVTTLYGHLGRGRTAALLLGAGLLWSAPQPASALEIRHDQDVRVAAGEVFGETLVATGDLVEIDGVLDGDLIAAVERLTVRGTVRGSIYALTRDLEISGTVEGSVHAGSERTRIGGSVLGSVFSGGEVLIVPSGGRIARDLYSGGEDTQVEGEVARDTWFAGKRFAVRGILGRNLDVFHADELSLRDGARIRGDIEARVAEDDFDVASGARVDGKTVRTDPHSVEDHLLSRYAKPRFYGFVLIKLAASLVFGLLLYRLLPWLFASELPQAGGFFRALGVGFLVLVATPVAILLCALTVIGLPVAVLGACLYVTALYTGHIAVGALLGRVLMAREEDPVPFGLALLVGLSVLALAINVPFVGMPVGIVAILFGAGLLYYRVREGFGAARLP